MGCALIVVAHPLEDSFCQALAQTAISALTRAGHAVDVIDLYRDGFDPRMTAFERQHHHAVKDASSPRPPYADRISAADHIVLVFPHWWFHLPAILKGFFDRCFAPGVAYTHVAGSGQFVPLLTGLRQMSVITTLGAPAWYHYFVLWQPVRRMLRRAVLQTCAPQAKFDMLALHSIESTSLDERQAFLAKVERWLPERVHG